MFDVVERSRAVHQRAYYRNDLPSSEIVGAAQPQGGVEIDLLGATVGAATAFFAYSRTKSMAWAVGGFFGGYLLPVMAASFMLGMYVESQR